MNLNSFSRKFTLAVSIAGGGVVWLNEWHRYGYSRGPVVFPPVSNWLRDAMIVLIPVMLAVWIGVALAQWFIDRAGERMSPSAQSILSAAILGAGTSFTTILMENNKIIWTGIGNEFVFLASICRAINPNGNLLLSILELIFPGYQALRLHILLQDGFYLMLVNLAITILLILILEGIAKARNSYDRGSGELASIAKGDPGQV